MYVEKEPEALIRDFHRQNMFLACHPLVTIVAHPWWWHGKWIDPDGKYRTKPWFEDFSVIPASLHDEFAAAVKENGKIVEINLWAMLLTHAYEESFKRQYLEYLAGLKSRGVKFSIGSDTHEGKYQVDLVESARRLDSVGITEQDLWTLPARV